MEGTPTQKRYRPQRFLLQWHITDRCNLRCAHCYQEKYRGSEPGLAQWVDIVEQFQRFLAQCSSTGSAGLRGHVTVTGGEPWMHPQFGRLLELLEARKEWFSFAVLTNGTLIDARVAESLRRLGTVFVQVSIEGSRRTHNRIRGEGAFERAVSGINALVNAGVTTLIAFTAHRGNFKEFGEVARLAADLGVQRVWADRLVPQGSGAGLEELILTPWETRKFFASMRIARDALGKLRPHPVQVSMHRALQFLEGGGNPYHCTAGDALAAVLPNGDLLPCRRMPIAVGNLFKAPLADLYDAPLFSDLRDRRRISKGCWGCIYTHLCRGGLRCLSYALAGDPFKKDPGCWFSFQE